MISLRKATKTDVDAIRFLSQRFYLTTLPNFGGKGATCAVYQKDVLENMLAEGLSVALTSDNQLKGYLLGCTDVGMLSAFGQTIAQSLDGYEKIIDEDCGYLPQACIEPNFRGEGHYRKMMTFVFDQLRRKNVRSVYGEILNLNSGSKTINNAIGLEKISQVTHNSLLDFKGNDVEAILNLEHLHEFPTLVEWGLYKQKI